MARKKNMKVFYILTAISFLSFLNLNAQSPFSRNYIFKSDSLNNRADQSSAITLDNGDLVVAFSRFGNSWLDTAKSAIFISTSRDGGYKWDEGSELIAPISLGSYIPSFYRKSNGNILCVFFVRETASPSYTSTLRQIEFDGNLQNIIKPTQIIHTGGYNPVGSDRLFYDLTNDVLLVPYPILISGTGHSTVSVYEGGLLFSLDEGNTWMDSGLELKVNLDMKGYGGCMESGLFKYSDGFGYYCRTTLGNIQLSKLTYTGTPPSYYNSSTFNNIGLSAQNAQSTIKYIDRINLFVASYTDVNNSDPLIFDRQSMGISISDDGMNWSRVLTLDSVGNSGYQINSVNIFEDKVNDNLIFFYSIAPHSGYFDLACKVISISDLFLESGTILNNEETEKNISNVYPNPSSDFIVTSGLVNKGDYKIFNSFGAIIQNGSNRDNEKIEINNLSSGIYLLRFSNGNTIKFIKK